MKQKQTAIALVPKAEPQTPMQLLSKAVASGASIETLKELTTLVRDWKKDAAEEAFNNALADAAAEIPVIAKTQRVRFTGKAGAPTDYLFADYASIYRVIIPILSKHGLHPHFRTESPLNEPVKVTCVISHRGGHKEENWLSAARDTSGNKNDIQALGSVVTYLQRYTLMAALGLAASKDTDGFVPSATSITLKQAEELLELINKTHLGAEQFCVAYAIEDVRELPAESFAQALQRLQARAEAITEKGSKK